MPGEGPRAVTASFISTVGGPAMNETDDGFVDRLWRR